MKLVKINTPDENFEAFTDRYGDQVKFQALEPHEQFETAVLNEENTERVAVHISTFLQRFAGAPVDPQNLMKMKTDLEIYLQGVGWKVIALKLSVNAGGKLNVEGHFFPPSVP